MSSEPPPTLLEPPTQLTFSQIEHQEYQPLLPVDMPIVPERSGRRNCREVPRRDDCAGSGCDRLHRMKHQCIAALWHLNDDRFVCEQAALWSETGVELTMASHPQWHAGSRVLHGSRSTAGDHQYTTAVPTLYVA